MTLTVVDRDGNDVRRIATAVPADPDQPLRATWDGTGERRPPRARRALPAARQPAQARPGGDPASRRLSRHDRADADRLRGRPRRALDHGAGGQARPVPRARRLVTPADAGDRAAHGRRTAARGGVLRAAPRRAPRGLGREGERRGGAARDLSDRGRGARHRGQRRALRARRAGAGHDRRPPGRERAPAARAAPRRSGADGSARALRRRLARAAVHVEHPPRRRRPAGPPRAGEHRRGPVGRAPDRPRRALPAGGAGGQRLHPRALRGPGLRAGADPRRPPGHHVVRPRSARRRP